MISSCWKCPVCALLTLFSTHSKSRPQLPFLGLQRLQRSQLRQWRNLKRLFPLACHFAFWVRLSRSINTLAAFTHVIFNSSATPAPFRRPQQGVARGFCITVICQNSLHPLRLEYNMMIREVVHTGAHKHSYRQPCHCMIRAGGIGDLLNKTSDYGLFTRSSKVK